jgi:hypothetical protein
MTESSTPTNVALGRFNCMLPESVAAKIQQEQSDRLLTIKRGLAQCLATCDHEEGLGHYIRYNMPLVIPVSILRAMCGNISFDDIFCPRLHLRFFYKKILKFIF